MLCIWGRDCLLSRRQSYVTPSYSNCVSTPTTPPFLICLPVDQNPHYAVNQDLGRGISPNSKFLRQRINSLRGKKSPRLKVSWWHISKNKDPKLLGHFQQCPTSLGILCVQYQEPNKKITFPPPPPNSIRGLPDCHKVKIKSNLKALQACFKRLEALSY